MTNYQTHVVVAYNFSRSAQSAMYRAIDLAKRDPTNVLHFVCVVPTYGAIPQLPHHGRADYLYTEKVQQVLTGVLADELRAMDIEKRIQFFVHVRIGQASDEILMVAREIGADLIIVGTKGRTGVEHALQGSVAEHVVREAGCTVEVARDKRYEYVELLDVTEKVNEEHRRYVPPHRYTYDQTCAALRPDEWPLY